MANTKSAEKRNRQAQKRNARNSAVKSTVKNAIKTARAAMTSGDPVKAKTAVAAATSALAKAATKGVLHAKNASRRIGRLTAEATKKAAAPAAK